MFSFRDVFKNCQRNQTFHKKAFYFYMALFLNHRYSFILTNRVFILLNQVYMGHTLPPFVYLDISEIYYNLGFVFLSMFSLCVFVSFPVCVCIVPCVCLYRAQCVFESCPSVCLYRDLGLHISCILPCMPPTFLVVFLQVRVVLLRVGLGVYRRRGSVLRGSHQTLLDELI